MKIVQIMPADGWQAVRKAGDAQKLVAWALVEDDDGGRSVRGVVPPVDPQEAEMLELGCYLVSDDGSFSHYDEGGMSDADWQEFLAELEFGGSQPATDPAT